MLLFEMLEFIDELVSDRKRNQQGLGGWSRTFFRPRVLRGT